LPKRRVKRIVNLIFFLLFIFIVTICVLFLSSLLFLKKTRAVITPLGILKNNPIINSNTSIQQSSDLQKIFDTYHLSFSNVSIGTDSAMHVALSDGREIIFSKNKQLDSQLASLQLIMNRLTIEGKHFIRIDFRFDDPVITF